MMPPVKLFDPAAFLFRLFWNDDVLARDLRVLAECGRVSADLATTGHDCPAGWFAACAMTYSDRDEQGALARRALQRVAIALGEGTAH
jgi:hypothetical protein